MVVPGVQQMLEDLGGNWGKVKLQEKFEPAEQALWTVVQGAQESNDSYLGRARVAWSELKSKGIDLEELEAYARPRHCTLTPEDKKQII